jgi:hypothetical protein
MEVQFEWSEEPSQVRDEFQTSEEQHSEQTYAHFQLYQSRIEDRTTLNEEDLDTLQANSKCHFASEIAEIKLSDMDLHQSLSPGSA